MPASEIPSWFDLRNYQKALTKNGWAYEIWVRANFYGQENHDTTGFLTFHMPTEEDTKSAFKKLLAMKALDPTRENYRNFLENNDFFREIFKRRTDAWNEELNFPAIYFDSDNKEQADHWPEELFDYANQIVSDPDLIKITSPININLDKSDAEIKKAFNEHLKKLREQQPEYAFTKKTPYDEIICKYQRYEILALFDLLYWRQAFNDNLGFDTIGKAIWGDKPIDDYEQRIKRTCIPIIDKYMTVITARTLYFEEKSKSSV